MRKNGAMFICNRCRKQVFAERIDDGKYDSKPLDGWALDCERICGVGDLCPDCFKAYREAMDGFLEWWKAWDLKKFAVTAAGTKAIPGFASMACR